MLPLSRAFGPYPGWHAKCLFASLDKPLSPGHNGVPDGAVERPPIVQQHTAKEKPPATTTADELWFLLNGSDWNQFGVSRVLRGAARGRRPDRGGGGGALQPD